MNIVYGLLDAKKALLDLRDLEGSDQYESSKNAVESILSQVRSLGDTALRKLTLDFEGINITDLEVPRSEFTAAYDRVPKEVVNSLEIAADRIRRFHSSSLPKNWMDDCEGYGEIFNPVRRVGVYIPGGNASFPSTVLMTVIPARVAGVPEVIITTPSSDGNTPHPSVLVAADISGVDRVFQVGGAQAIAAMAFGTDTIPRVDLICGPGGLHTTLAKKSVFGTVGIDGLYGPTETVLIADETANPTLCAADLVAQAEHDALATPVLITTSKQLAVSAQKEAKLRASLLPRSVIAMKSLNDRGIVAVVDNLDEAIELSNSFAPEHLCLLVRNPSNHLRKIENAGAIFLGEFSHEVLGDYIAGPSHVMPTGGTSKFGSGVGVHTFLKVSSVIFLDEKRAASLSKPASILARSEGFTGHAEAAEIRDELVHNPVTRECDEI